MGAICIQGQIKNILTVDDFEEEVAERTEGSRTETLNLYPCNSSSDIVIASKNWIPGRDPTTLPYNWSTNGTTGVIERKVYFNLLTDEDTGELDDSSKGSYYSLTFNNYLGAAFSENCIFYPILKIDDVETYFDFVRESILGSYEEPTVYRNKSVSISKINTEDFFMVNFWCSNGQTYLDIDCSDGISINLT